MVISIFDVTIYFYNIYNFSYNEYINKKLNYQMILYFLRII